MQKCLETDVTDIAKLACDKKADFAIIGLENPLGVGISNELESVGIPTVGPRKKPAEIEGSKLFARNLMERHGIGKVTLINNEIRNIHNIRLVSENILATNIS